MVYNKATYTGFIAESAVPAESTCVDPLQFCIEAAETDHKLFEALITVDMTEAANSKGVINLSESELNYMVEATSGGIIDRLKGLIAKFKEMVSKLFTRFTTFISNLVSNDKKLYARYKDQVVPAKLKGCPVKGNTVNVKETGTVDSITNSIISNAIKAADNWKDADLSAIIESMEADLEKLKSINVVNKEDKPIIEKIDVNTICFSMRDGYKKQVDLMTNSKSMTENLIKTAQLEIRDLEIKEKDSKAAENYNKAYESLSKILNITSQSLSAVISIQKTVIALHRSAFIKLGKWVAGGGKTEEEDVKGEAVNMLIDIANESFCESAWENAI